MKPKPILNEKQKRFCREYLIDMNGTQAAIRAGYAPNTAKVQASRLLTNANIDQYLKALKSELAERLNITAERVIEELARIGFSNVQDFVDDGNIIRDLKDMHREQIAPVAGIKVIEVVGESGSKTTTELKFHDKVSALEKLGRHLGIFEKDNNQQKANMPTVIVPGTGK